MQRDPALDHAGNRAIDPIRRTTPPPLPQPDITDDIANLTDKVISQTNQVIIKRVVNEMVKEGKLSLTGKMAALTDRAQDFTKKTEDVLDGIAEKITQAEVKRDAAVEKHHAYYDGIIKGVDESISVIERLSNVPLSGDGEH